MREKRQVIFNLIKEVHDICEENKIEYFLDDRLDSYATYYQELPIDTDSAIVLMRAEELRKFITAFNNNPIKDRSIEYMGNSPFFSGFFLNYCDETTTHYNRKKLATENCLGMEITIHVLRPINYRKRIMLALEQAWTNLAYGSNCSGAKLEPIIRKQLENRIREKGRLATSKGVFDYLLNKYSKDNRKGYWIRTKKGKRKKFKYDTFEEPVYKTISDEQFCFLKTRENKFSRAKYLKRPLVETPNTQHSFFDTEISYKELELEDFRNSMRDIVCSLRNQSKADREIKRKKLATVDALFRSYWRYYFALKFEGNISQIVNLFEDEKYDELDRIMLPYVNQLLKYKNIYLCEEINRILEQRYGIVLENVFKDVPKKYKKGISIYDYSGKHIRTIMGDTDGRSTKFTV